MLSRAISGQHLYYTFYFKDYLYRYDADWYNRARENMNMYDFDAITDRNTPDDIKYGKINGIDDLIPLWVADMDFKSPPEVIDELVRVASNGIYGYSEADKSYDDAVISWFKNRFDWDVDASQIVKLPGVVLAISYAVRVLTEENDHVMIFEPVYGPFRRCVEGNGRKLTIEQLKIVNGHFEIDLEEMEKKIAQDDVKLLIWCSPHNPGGRVWTEEELRAVSDICKKHGVFIVSDEIHSDLTLYGNKHIPMAKIAGDNCVVLTAPTKGRKHNIDQQGSAQKDRPGSRNHRRFRPKQDGHRSHKSRLHIRRAVAY